MTDNKSAKELGLELIAKQDAAKAFFESKKGEDGQIRMTDEDRDRHLAELRELNDLNDRHQKAIEMEGLVEKMNASRRDMDRVANPDVVPQGNRADADTPVVKTLEQLLDENADYRAGIARGEHKRGMIAVEVPEFKTTMTTAAGFAPHTMRNGVVVPYAVYGPTIEDIIPSYSTTDNSVVYMEETTHTNNVAAVAENAVLGESAFAYTQRTAAIEDVGAFLPVTERQIEDVPAAAALIEGRLGLQARVKRAHYILNGNGSTPQITGFLSASGLQTQAKGSDSVPDAVHKAITKVNVTGAANASAIVMNPTDWQIVRLLTTADGVYIYGNPSEAIAPRMWGLPVVLENNIAAGTALVGDFQMFSQIANRKNVTVEFGRSGDDFKYGRFTARVTTRFGLVVYRGAAFCSVTSIA